MITRPSRSYLEHVIGRALDQAKERSAKLPRAVAVYARDWQDGDSLEVAGDPWRIVFADSVLEVRGVLDEHAERDERVVLLTPLTETQLGHDVRARLAGAKVYSLDVVGTVGRMFRANRVDTARLEKPVLATLIEHEPHGGYPPVPSGILGAEDVWESFFRYVVSVDELVVDLPALLRWTLDPQKVARWRGLEASVRAAAGKKLADIAGSGAETLVSWIENGHGKDALALAIACEVVFATVPEDAAGSSTLDREEISRLLDRAAVRLERGARPIAREAGRALGDAAQDVIRGAQATEDGAERRDGAHIEAIRAALVRADDLLRGELGVAMVAWLGSLTQSSFAQRLERSSDAVVRAVEKPFPARLLEARARLRDFASHRLAVTFPESIERARMALRLAQWFASPEKDFSSFEEAAVGWVLRESFVDRARECILAGEHRAGPTKSYEFLAGRALAKRSRANRAFAKLLEDWLEHGGTSDRVIPVERFVDEVLARLGASGHKVLLIVLDGLSWPIAHGLREDLAHKEIAETSWFAGRVGADREFAVTLVSTVPSITAIARTSLFAGELRRGRQNDERRAFAEHPSLVTHSRSDHPPLLFHKAEVAGEGGSIPRELRREIQNEDRRFVAVVVNAIDDSLSGAQQQRSLWNLDTIKPLGPLIAESFDAGRVVVLASDHGHVLHAPGESLEAEGGGDRWRPLGKRPLSEGEIVLRGPRVRGAEDEREVVVLADERLHYGPSRNGSHGGATPQEMLAPVAILTPHGRELAGLEPVELEAPRWWDVDADLASAEASEVRETHDGERATFEVIEKDAAVLFEEPVEIARARVFEDLGPRTREDRASAHETPAWIATLFASETWAAQRELNRKKTLSDEQVEKMLIALDRAGGSLTTLAFAKALGTSRMRVDGFLAMAQRLLNVDGYDVLGHDRERDQVELDRELLRQQFGLGG